MKNLQMKTWLAFVGLLVIVQLGAWTGHFLQPSTLPLLPFAAIVFAMSALFVFVGFLLIRFVPPEKRMRWGIPIMSAIVVFEIGVVIWELAQGTTLNRSIMRLVLHAGVLGLLWWEKHHQARNQSEKELKI